jgi:hypothetical protein
LEDGSASFGGDEGTCTRLLCRLGDSTFTGALGEASFTTGSAAALLTCFLLTWFFFFFFLDHVNRCGFAGETSAAAFF